MWVCIQSEPNLWTTGFYRPDGRWEPAGDDHPSHEAALQQVAWLNGTSNVVARDLMNQKADLLAALRAILTWDDMWTRGKVGIMAIKPLLAEAEAVVAAIEKAS